MVKPFGTNFLLVTDDRISALGELISQIANQLKQNNQKSAHFGQVYNEPDPDTIDRALDYAVLSGCDAVISVGGGSVIDTGKAVAGLIPNGGPIVEYLEGVGTGRTLKNKPVPFIAVPTTSGTGAEVTKNAVITSIKEGYKKSFRSDDLLAKLVIVDPLLTVSLPKAQTAASGMDALTQLIESYTTKKHNPICDGMALEGIKLSARSLLAACENGNDLQAREDMAAASLMSGLCLANSGLGAAHGIAASLGAHKNIGHGLACAILLPYVMELNRPVCPERFADIGKAMGCTADSLEGYANAGIEFVRDLGKRIGIPADLKSFNITADEIPVLARDSAGSSMSGNPVQLDTEGWADFIRRLC